MPRRVRADGCPPSSGHGPDAVPRLGRSFIRDSDPNQPAGPRLRSDTRGMARILLTDPDPSYRSLLAAVVRGLGHEAVHTWAEGSAPVDLVVLEPAAPEGIRMGLALRSLYPRLPIVCVSSRDAIAAALALEPAAYLVKPVSLAELEAALTAALPG